MEAFGRLLVATALLGWVLGCGAKSANTVGGVSAAPPHWPPHMHGLNPETMEECPWQSRTYDPAWVSARAEELNLRPVDYLHRVNNKEIKP